MFTRFLFKPSLAFTTFALVLLSQIAATGTAFAVGPTSVDNVPNFNCLDVSNSTALGAKVVPVVSPSPPGQGIQFRLFYRALNNCTSGNPVSDVTVTATPNIVCPPPTLGNAKSNSYEAKNPIAQGQPAAASFLATAYCIEYQGIIPVSSEVPTSITINFTATGINANGQKVFSSAKTVTVQW
jgi:hypothetical protein